MDPFSGLKNEVFRPLAAVVLPGMLALAPFAVIAANGLPEIARFYGEQPNWFLVAFVATGTIVGLLLENVGSSIERGIDRCMENEFLPGHDAVWLAYLSCGTVDNNGRRFLAGIVTRLKFINSLMPALAFLGLGTIFLHIQNDNWASWKFWSFQAALLILQVWLFRTSTELSEVASSTRYHLLDRRLRPPEYDPTRQSGRRHRHFAYVIGELLTSRVSEIDLRNRIWLAVICDSLRLLSGQVRKEPAVGA